MCELEEEEEAVIGTRFCSEVLLVKCMDPIDDIVDATGCCFKISNKTKENKIKGLYVYTHCIIYKTEKRI